MASFIARVILWVCFAFIFVETVREMNTLFNLSFNPSWALIPAILIYLFQEFMIKKWRVREESATQKLTETTAEKILYIMAWFIVGILFLCILIVWALAIYNQIVKTS